jgi:hypothetical protein
MINLSEIQNKELIETLRLQKVTELLNKVSLKQVLSDDEIIELRNDVKTSDLKDRILLVKKAGTKFHVTYSNHIFSFLTKSLTTSSKRIPLQILAVKYGNCLNYLESLGFETDFESTKADYNKAISELSNRIAKTNTEDEISDILVNSKFTTKVYNKALRSYDINKSLSENVSYGTVSESVLTKFKAAEAAAAAKAAKAAEAAKAAAEAKAAEAAAFELKKAAAVDIVAAKAAALLAAKEKAEAIKANIAAAKAAAEANKAAEAKAKAAADKAAAKAAKAAEAAKKLQKAAKAAKK